MKVVMTKVTVPVVSILIFFGLVLGMVLWVLPDRDNLLMRMLADENLDRAEELLAATPQDKISQKKEFYILAENKVKRGRESEKNISGLLSPEQSSTLMEKNWKDYQDLEEQKGFLNEMVIVLAKSVWTASAKNWLDRIRGEVSAEDFVKLMQEMKEKALKFKNPAMAAQSKRDLITSGVSGPFRHLQEAVSYWRQASLPEEALKDLDHYEIKGDLEDDTWLWEFLQLKVVVLRGMNRNDLALALYQNHQSLFERKQGQEQALQFAALMAEQAGNQQESLQYINQILEGNPQNQAALEKAGRLASGLKEFDRAINYYNRLIKLSGGDNDKRHFLAQIEEWKGSPVQAFDQYKVNAMEGDLRAIERMLALNPGLYRSDELIDALKVFLSIKDNSEYSLILADMLTQRGDYDEAKEYYRARLEKYPDDAATLLNLARNEAVQDRFEEALSIYQKLFALGKGGEEPVKKMIDLEIKLGKYNDAFELARQFAPLSKDEEMIRQYLNLADIMGELEDQMIAYQILVDTEGLAETEDYISYAYLCHLLGKEDQKRQILKMGAEKRKDGEHLRYLYAIAEGDKGNYASALEIMRSLILEINNQTIRIYFLQLLIMNSHTSEALDYVEKNFSQIDYQSSVELTKTVAQIYEMAGEYSKSLPFYASIYQQTPQDTASLVDYARILHRMGRRSESEKLIKSLKLKDNPQTIKIVAACYLDLELYEEAAKLLEQYKKLVPNTDMQVLRWLGDARLSSGDPRKAKRSYKQALQKMTRELQVIK